MSAAGEPSGRARRGLPGGLRPTEIIAAYDADAGALAAEYERDPFEKIHQPVLDLLPEAPSSVLDVGAGSGRDAAWFAGQGHQVVALEPAAGMRAEGSRRHAAGFRWLDDSLPGLDRLVRSGLTFDLVWLSAVWMHVPPACRERAFRKLVSVLSPGGSMMVSLRQGPPPPGRAMAPAMVAEIEELARRLGLQCVRCHRQRDAAGRPGVHWDVVWLRLPDDGTGALPLLRHVVFNDRKSSTYKLALLRTLIRIADGAGGFARRGAEDGSVALPLGLVALYWVRGFRPLLAAGLPQLPQGNSRLGFVDDGFRGLETRSPFDLRVGQRFGGADAGHLIQALRTAARCIRRMPATHIRYPGSDRPVFPCHGKPVGLCDEVRIDAAFLWSFGSFRVPGHLWQAMGRYAPWIEPAVLGEWTAVMRGYRSAPPDAAVRAAAALRWLDPGHDTREVREVGLRFRARRQGLHCVWSGRRLDRDFDIDHCFPFAAWPCNDLWNLLPSAAPVNRRKGDRLPAREALYSARERMQEWWWAYLEDPRLRPRFAEECRSALPLAADASGEVTPDSLFDGLVFQQMVLRRDQRLAEWSPP